MPLYCIAASIASNEDGAIKLGAFNVPRSINMLGAEVDVVAGDDEWCHDGS
jgi:hypothetical protein